MTKLKSKKEVILEAQEEQRTVYFATLTDTCRLKNAELEPKFQNTKFGLCSEGDIVKDDSGSYAVFKEQVFVCISDDRRRG